MSNKIELKPCHFCGADAGLFVDNGVRVICKVCGAQTMTLIDGGVNAGGGAVKRVLDKWNRKLRITGWATGAAGQGRTTDDKDGTIQRLPKPVTRLSRPLRGL